MGPIVLGVSFVLVLSAAALTPGIDPDEFAAVAGTVALWGLVRGIISTVGIRRIMKDPEIHWTDIWFYGIIPTVTYLALGIVAFAIWTGAPWALDAAAAMTIAILLSAIRNEWDLITWIAPKSDTPKSLETGPEAH